MPEFNLLDENWIECIDSTGKPTEMGIRQIITEAHHVKKLANSIPLVNASIFFLLETILIRSLSNAGIALDDYDEWFKGYKAGTFDTKMLDAYFQIWHARFYLFDEEYPFLQSNIEGQEFTGTAMKLLPHYSGGTGGNSATLFDQHTMQEGISLSMKQAANYLLPAHQYGAGGRIIGSDYFSESLPDNGLSFFVEGGNFFETLYLNLLPYPDLDITTKAGDCPIWERDDPDDICGRNSIIEGKNKSYQPLGLLDLLTWPGRKIHLLLDDDQHIHEIKMRSGIKMIGQTFPWYAYDQRGYYIRAQLDHAVWRDYAVLLQFREMVSGEDDKSRSPYPVQWLHGLASDGYSFDHPFHIIGLGMAKEAGKQKVSFYSEQRLPLPQEYLINKDLVADIANQLKLAETVQGSLYGTMMAFAEILLSFNVDKKNGRKPDPNDKRNLVDHLGAQRIYWGELGNAFSALIANLPDDREKAILQWKTSIRNSARDAFDQAVSLVGESIHVLKAAATARRMLEAGLKKNL
ncbi:MAG: type I-E CRISPR-associated protein Cse1/CasA [Anaerolineaceae bacterium]